MKYASYFFWIILLAGMNFGLFSSISLFGSAPNLFLLFVAAAGSLAPDLPEKLFVALVCGLFADFSSGGVFGGYTFSFLFLCLLLEAIASAFSVYDMDWKFFAAVAVFAYVFCAVFVWTFNFAAFRLHWAENYPALSGYIGRWLPELFYNLLVLYPVVRFFRFVQAVNRKYFEIRPS